MRRTPIYPIESDVYLTWKKPGISSFGWITRTKRSHTFKKIGHAGTLDPFAEGLLIIGVNAGTKKLSNYVGLSKDYRTTIVLGETTDTLDPTGTVTDERTITAEEFPHIQQSIQRLWPALVGSHSLVVPSFSAKKVAGQTLYKLARAGKDVPTIHHTALITATELLSIKYESGRIYITAEFSVGSGTYIRALAQYIGEQLGIPARLETLVRKRVGDYHIPSFSERIYNFFMKLFCH